MKFTTSVNIKHFHRYTSLKFKILCNVSNHKTSCHFMSLYTGFDFS